MAVIERANGPLIDGTVYDDEDFQRELEEYHEAAVTAHREHAKVTISMPQPRVRQLTLQPVAAGTWRTATPRPLFAPAGTITGEIVPANGNGSVDFVPRANGNGARRRPRPRRRRPSPRARAFARAAVGPVRRRARAGRAGAGGDRRLRRRHERLGRAGPGPADQHDHRVLPHPAGGSSPSLAIIVGVVRAQQANRRRAEEARDRANERAQLLAAAMDPEVAMRLLGYDGREK